MADIKQITPENFDSVVSDNLPVLVDFGRLVRALPIALAHR